jgi:hypothetical protein
LDIQSARPAVGWSRIHGDISITCQVFSGLFERSSPIEREFGHEIPACVSYSRGVQDLKRKLAMSFVGGDIAWTYRFARSEETSPGLLCVGRDRTGDNELFRVIGRHQHRTMLRSSLVKLPVVLYRLPDPLVDLLQGNSVFSISPTSIKKQFFSIKVYR